MNRMMELCRAQHGELPAPQADEAHEWNSTAVPRSSPRATAHRRAWVRSSRARLRRARPRPVLREKRPEHAPPRRTVDSPRPVLQIGGTTEEAHGHPQHQEPARPALPEAPGAGEAAAPLRRAGGDAHPRGGAGRAGAAVDPRAPGPGQGAVEREGRGGARGVRPPLVGLTEEVGTGPVALDTAIFIYLIEEHPTYLPAVRPLFEGADRGELEIVTSAITLLEVLVVPYRAGNLPLAARYEALLTRSRGVRLIDLDRTQLRAAA